MTKEIVLVIGANSFSGSDFVELLLEERQYQVVGLSRSKESGPLLLPYLNHPQASDRFQYYQLDMVREPERFIELLKAINPDYVVNFAALSEVALSWEIPDQYFAINGTVIATLSDFLRRQPRLKRYLHISSPEVYGSCAGNIDESAPLNPSTPYAASKAAGDLMLSTLVKQFNFNCSIIRATNVYGAHQQLFKIIPRAMIYLKMGKILQLHGGGQAVKSFIHIRDVSRGELAAMEQGQNGAIYHLSPDGGGVSIRDLIQQICTLRGADFEQVTHCVNERPGQDKAYIIDSGKARNRLGWQPQISLVEGLTQTADWIDQSWQEIKQAPLEYIHQNSLG